MVAAGASVVDETASSGAVVGSGGASVGVVSIDVSVATGAEVADASVVVAGTGVVVVVAGTEVVVVVAGTEVVVVVAGTEVVVVVAGTDAGVAAVVSATTTVVPRTSEVPGSTEDGLPPQPAATTSTIRLAATHRFMTKVSQITRVDVSRHMATFQDSTTPICLLAP